MPTEPVKRIINTRYRDIPFEEAVRCAPDTNTPSGSRWWVEHRGQPVAIEVPASTISSKFYICGGPFFIIAGTDHSAVCPHIAEIGD